MKTQYFTATSLDGFIADENHSLDWLFQFGAEPGTEYDEFMEQIGAIAMGASTYEWLLAHEIQPESETHKPWPYQIPTWVFTARILHVIPGANIHFVNGDVRPVHAEMVKAAGGKNIWVAGGGELVGQFYDHRLLDELFIELTSVTLGQGAPLLPRRIITPPLKLISAKSRGTAMVQLKYEVQYPPVSQG